MTDQKITAEMAEQEFERFAEAMDLEFDVSTMNEEEKTSFEGLKSKLVKALCRGTLVVNEDGEPVFTPVRGGIAENAITFHEPTGAALMAMDSKKKNEDVAKMFATMAGMTKEPSKTFASMKSADLKICMAIATLFLA